MAASAITNSNRPSAHQPMATPACPACVKVHRSAIQHRPGIPTHESLPSPRQFQPPGTGVRCRGHADIHLIERQQRNTSEIVVTLNPDAQECRDVDARVLVSSLLRC